MLEFLLDPAFIALGGTVALGGGATIIQKVLGQKKDEAKTEEVIVESPKKLKPEDCVLFAHRAVEQLLVDSGDMLPEDVLTCSVDKCPNCIPIRKMVKDKYEVEFRGETYTAPSKNVTFTTPKKNTIPVPPKGSGGGGNVHKNIYGREDKKPADSAPDFEKFAWLRRNDPRYRGYTFKDYEFQERLRKSKEWLAKQEESQTYKCAHCHDYASHNAIHICEQKQPKVTPKSKPNHSRVVKVGPGMEIIRPANVPNFAKATHRYNDALMTDEILWTWDYDEGRKYSYVQRYTADIIEFQDGAGAVVKKIHEIYDPETGEYLGSYNSAREKAEIKAEQERKQRAEEEKRAKEESFRKEAEVKQKQIEEFYERMMRMEERILLLDDRVEERFGDVV